MSWAAWMSRCGWRVRRPALPTGSRWRSSSSPRPSRRCQAITDALLNKDSDNSESPGAAQVGLRLRPQTLLRAVVATLFDLELESEAPAPLSMPGVPQSR